MQRTIFVANSHDRHPLRFRPWLSPGPGPSQCGYVSRPVGAQAKTSETKRPCSCSTTSTHFCASASLAPDASR